MRHLLSKELRLSAQPFTYLFVLSGLLFLLPGYPVLCGVFFLTLGLYQNFRYARECNDLAFSVLLPIAKKDVVKGKFVFSCLAELSCAALMLASVIARMTVFADAPVYRENALMNANLFALGVAFILFGVFNLAFISCFFKTGCRVGKPFIVYMTLCFVIISASEALHHVPGMQVLNAFGFDHFGLPIGALAVGCICYIGLTLLAYRISCRRFETMDL